MSDNYFGNHPAKDINRKVLFGHAREAMGENAWLNLNHIVLASREGKDIEYLLKDGVKPQHITAVEKNWDAYKAVVKKFVSFDNYNAGRFYVKQHIEGSSKNPEFYHGLIDKVADDKWKTAGCLGLISYDCCGTLCDTTVQNAPIFPSKAFLVTMQKGREFGKYIEKIRLFERVLRFNTWPDKAIGNIARAHAFMTTFNQHYVDSFNCYVPYVLTYYSNPNGIVFWSALFIEGKSPLNIHSNLGGFHHIYNIGKEKVIEHWQEDHKSAYNRPVFNRKIKNKAA